MMEKIDSFFKRFTKDLDDDISNNRSFCIVTYSSLGLVALVMTIMNVATHKGFLTICTAVFAILCAVNIILVLLGTVGNRIAKVLFATEVIGMFSFFLVSGNPEGFSAIWICMLPSIGMFFFNRTRGTIICAIMFVIMIFFLWIPYGQSLLMFDYSDAFMMRFPVLFLAFHLVAYLLETLRVNAFREMRRMQEHYLELSIRDPLTKIYNRQGMYGYLEHSSRFRDPQRVGAIMFDIDHFKDVNDAYGHDVGDMVLSHFAELIRNNLQAVPCRWGGEEFVAIYIDDEIRPEQLSMLKDIVEKEPFYHNGNAFHITTSIGVASEYGFDVSQIDSLISKADQALYVAKNSGRNRIIYYHDITEQQTGQQT